MYIQEYIDEECKRIKLELKKEFDAILAPLEASLKTMEMDIAELDKITSYSFILDLIEKGIKK